MRLPYKHAMTVAAHRGDSYNYYENTITAFEKGIEPWIGAAITQAYKLALCASYGAKLITTNHPADAIEKLEKHGYRSK